MITRLLGSTVKKGFMLSLSLLLAFVSIGLHAEKVSADAIDTWGNITDPPRVESYSYINKIAVDHAGTIYLPDLGANKVRYLPENTSTWSKWGTADDGYGTGTAEGEFNTPSGVALDGSQNIYVVESPQNGEGARVQMYDRMTSTWQIIDGAEPKLYLPGGIAVAPDGSKIYVTEQGVHRVRMWRVQGMSNLEMLMDLH